MMKTAWITHELLLWHDTGTYAQVFAPSLTVQPGHHVESPETKRRFRNLVEVSGLIDHLVPIKPQPASDADLLRVHTRDYLDRLRTLSAGRGGDAGGLSPFGHGSFEIARLAAGAAIAGVEAVLQGSVAQAYVLARPPGHHALPDQGMGFCLLANAAIALRRAQACHGLRRVAIIDWDVHHGNGPQHIFYDDPGVFTLSLHQDRLFPPDSGTREENGARAGSGYNLNIPLPPGCAESAYLYALDTIVLPALRRYQPELIVVACGYDASAVDPLGRMLLTSESYRQMTARIRKAAADLCENRLVMIHEGGYSEMYVPYCGLAVLEELLDMRSDIRDPWLELSPDWSRHELQPHEREAIDAALGLVARVGGPKPQEITARHGVC